MTLRLYADNKKLPLQRVSVRLTHNKIHAEDCLNCETKEGMIDRIDRNITLEGALSADERKRPWKLPTSARAPNTGMKLKFAR
jgi:putative redox protein